MNVKEILIIGLTKEKADGLCNPGLECGCSIDDLAPCDSLDVIECSAAKFIKTNPDDSNYRDDFPEGYYEVI